MSFNSIPDEFKQYNQWVVWKYEGTQEGKPTKVPYNPHSGQLASVTNPASWCSFADAVNASSNYSGIGFVLSENDPFAVIDLDDTLGDQIALDRQLKVFQEFNTYSERSPSGKGLHIWLKGAVESGRRRSFIEVYSSGRYMTMTGNVYKDSPIEHRQELLTLLWQQMGGGAAHYIYEGNAEEKYNDQEILERACNAANGDKFRALLNGQWNDYYPSQSEADFAFIDIVAFYTQNRFQITRLFRNSALGQRAKALRADYTNYMINKSFDRMLPPVDVDGLRNQLEEMMKANAAKNRLPNLAAAGFLSGDAYLSLAQSEPEIPKAPEQSVYGVPPGLVGDIARFIYAAAPRPVPEIALAGAIGLMAGICGRSFNVSGTGLNQYVLLLAPTGTGKEAIASGIDKLMGVVQKTVPSAIEFVGPAEISSPQALSKYLVKCPCFVSMVGEFGLKLKQMCNWNASTHELGLRRMLLDLYNKSGDGKVLRSTIYSDKDKNTDAVLAPSLTLLGESTPEKFYESLDESMISEGLLPRFTTIEYHGHRPPLNPSHINATPDFRLIDQLSSLCAHSLMLTGANRVLPVEADKDAKDVFDKFDLYCDKQINGSSKEVPRHLWNRAHIKVMKLAALISVGINPYQPMITGDVATWALNIITADIRNLMTKFETGEIGIETAETRQIADVKRVIKDFLVTDTGTLIAKYKMILPQMHVDKIVQYKYIQARTVALASFRKHKSGEIASLEKVLKNLIATGDIQEVPGSQLQAKYGTKQKAYGIVNPQAFLNL